MELLILLGLVWDVVILLFVFSSWTVLKEVERNFKEYFSYDEEYVDGVEEEDETPIEVLFDVEDENPAVPLHSGVKNMQYVESVEWKEEVAL